MKSPPDAMARALQSTSSQPLLSGIASGLCTWDLENQQIHYDTDCRLILGYTASEASESFEQWLERLHTHDRKPTQLRIQQCLDGLTTCLWSITRMTCADGAQKTFLLLGRVAEHNAEGLPARLVARLIDIEDMKELGSDQRMVEAQMYSVFKYAAIGMALVAPDGRFTRVNPALCRIVGYTSEEMTALNFRDITHPDDLEKDLDYVTQMLQGEIDFYQMDKRYFHKKGHVVWIHLSVSLLHDETGQPESFIAQIQDISQQKRYEAQLKDAWRNAEAADLAKSNFLAMMSHEIRTPMNAIIGYADLLRYTDLNPEQKDFIGMIQNSGDLLLNLIDDILDISKIEAGELALDVRSFPLRPCVEESATLLMPRAEKKGLTLTTSVDASLPDFLTGDDHRLRQILINLLANAVKFTEHGTIELSVRRAQADNGDDCVEFCVRDSGIGMSAEQQERIFQPFSQADNSTTRRFGGTGLGLTICHRLIEAMGGTIGVTSKTGQGSVFRCTIPLLEGKSPEQAEGRKDPATHLKGRIAALLCGNAVTRHVIVHQLRRMGMVVEEYAQVEALMERDSEIGLNLLIVDESETHHEEALYEHLRNNVCEDAPLPIVVLTESFGADLSETHKDQHLLQLPLRQSELVDLLMTIMPPSIEVDQGKSDTSFARRYPANILVAEDNDANRDVVMRYLQAFGYDAEAVIDGSACLSALEQKHYDMIIMDVQMPVLNGIEATRKIREAEAELSGKSFMKLSPLKILALTADAVKGDRERCLDAGMNGYLSKPIRSHKLREALREQLTR